MDYELINEICLYLLENFNREFTIDDLENEFHYNKFYIIKKFKEITGYTIKEYINKYKVYNTVDPLIFTDDTILKIALSGGFNSLEYYSEKFKDVIGISPINFRKEYSIRGTSDRDKLLALKERLNEIKTEQEKIIELSIKEKDKPKVYIKAA